MIKPPRLKRGSKIGMIACSSPITGCSDETIRRSYDRLARLGFEVVEAPNCRTNHHYMAGTIAERVHWFHKFMFDPEIGAVMTFWGGLQTHQMLEHLDYAAIQKNPKIVIGYSDTTALQTALLAKSSLITFSGPAGLTFGKPELPDFTLDAWRTQLIEPQAPVSLPTSPEFTDNLWFLDPEQKMIFDKNPGWKIYRDGKARGRIIGGNLGTMLRLVGTPYWPDLNGAILFIEEDESENMGTIDRLLTQLRQMGVYKQIAGLVIGRFSRASVKNFTELKLLLGMALEGYDIPVITEVDFGHTDPMLTIPIGIECRINTATPEIVFLEAGVQ